MNSKNVLCISASNILHSQKNSISKIICDTIAQILAAKNITCDVIDLRNYSLSPCTGCGKCFHSKRCANDTAFNEIYDKIIKSDGL